MCVVALYAPHIALPEPLEQSPQPPITGAERCPKVGMIRIFSGTRYRCVRSQGKYSWKRVPVAARSTPTTTSSVPPIATVPLRTDNLVESSNCRLTDTNSQDAGISIGYPRNPHRLKSVGDIRVGVVFVDFPDSIAKRTTNSIFATISPEAEQRFKHLSYGKSNFVLFPLHKWIRMGQDSVSYQFNRNNNTYFAHVNYINEALSRARDQVDWGSMDGFLVITNPDTQAMDFGPAFTPNGSYWAEKGSGYRLMNGATSGVDLLFFKSGWFNHEFGHAMGLVDLYAYSALPYPSSIHRFVGWFSLMGWISPNGEGAPELFGWERWSLGWLDDLQVACLKRESATVDLDPIERPGGIKIFVMPLGENRAVIVESRRKLGYDLGLAQEGALVYLVDTSKRSGEGVVRVLPIDDGDTTKMTATLLPGETLEFEGIRIRVESKSSAGDRVTVSYGN